VIHAIQDAPKPANAVEVIATATSSGGNSATRRLHRDANDCIFRERSRESYRLTEVAFRRHGPQFRVPQLAGKTDLIPIASTTMWMDPHRTGIFLGKCAQYCGTQHAKMLLQDVDSREGFQAWANAQKQLPKQDER